MANHLVAGFMFTVVLNALMANGLYAQTALPVDSTTGLIISEGWLEVKARCTECHSAQMIVQNSGNRAVWKSRIVWMQESQGLGELSDEQEDSILSYLASNYGQKDATRRAPLPAHLMPANPLGSAE